MNILKFRNLNVFLTGGSRGIGLEIAKEISSHGGSVCILNRDSKVNEQVLSELPILHSDQKHTGLISDLSKPLNEADIRSKIEEKKFNCFIHCAGVTQSGLLLKTSDEDIDSIFNVNTLSAIKLSKYVLKGMMKEKYGRIVLVGSVLSEMGFPGETVYSSTKSALTGFAKSVSKEMGKFNITCNVVSPGFVETDMVLKSKLYQNQEAISKILESIPSKRFAKPNEIAKTVTHLLESEYINGQEIKINGGLY